MDVTQKHLKVRGLFVVLTITIFILIGFILDYDWNPEPIIELEQRPVIRRSCLGNPVFLPYAFIGLPSILILGVIDVFSLIFLKSITFKKLIINVLLMVFSFLLLFLLLF